MQREAPRARTPDRVDMRADGYEPKLHTKAGEVTLQVPRLRTLAFETRIIATGMDDSSGLPVTSISREDPHSLRR